jgi:AraC-like DNA-binding protein
MNVPNKLRYSSAAAPLGIEFDRRSGHYTMTTNHIHPEYELYYLFSGQRSYFIKDRSYPVQAGDLVFIRSGEVHKTTDVGVPEHERILIYFKEHYFRSMTPELGQLLSTPFQSSAPVLRLPMHERLQIESILFALMEELMHTPPGYELAVQHAAAELLLRTARYLKKNETAPLEHVSPMHEKISEIVRYINDHYAEPLQLPALSELFYVSPSHLSRKFKEITGFSFTDYVNLKRIKEAQRLLQQTNLSITDISEQVGFENFSHFGKMFKKITKQSARDYRKQ